MARFVYDATLVSMTLEKLNEAYNELENTEMEIDRGISMICSANGSEIMDIDFSPILNYFAQVTGGIDSISTNIKNTAHQIEDYQNAPWHKKLFSTIGMTGLKLVEGIGGVIENLGDGLVSIAGFAGGLFNSEFKESCAEFVKKDIVGDAFSNAYETGALQNVNKYSIYSHESTAANVFKGFGTAAAYIGISLVTGGSSLAKEVAIEATVAGITGIGQGTQEGLNAGKTFNSAFGQGLKTGVMAAAGEAVMGVAMNKIMKIPEVQNAIGSVVQKFGKAKAKFTSKAIKNTDEVVTAVTAHSDEIIETMTTKSDEVLTAGKKTDEVVEAIEKTDGQYKLTKDEIVQDDLAKAKPKQAETPKVKDAEVTPAKQVAKSEEVVTAGNKVDEVAQTAKASDGQYKLTRDEIIQDDLAKAKPKQVETPKVKDVEVTPAKPTPKVDEVMSSGKATEEVIQTNKTTDGQYRVTKDEIPQNDLAKAKPKQVETPKVKDAEIAPAKQTPKVTEVVQTTKTATKVEEVVSSVAVHSDESSAIANLTSGKTNIPSSAPTSSATKVAGNLGEIVDDIPMITSSSTGLVGATGTMMKVGLKSTDDIIGAGLKSTDNIIAQADEVVDGAKHTTKVQQSKSTPKKKSKVDVTKSSDELDEVVGATSVSDPTSADLSKVKRSMDEMGGRLVKKQQNLTSAQEALKAAKASGADDATITALQKNVDKAQKEYTRQYDSLMKKQKQYIEMTESGQFNKIGTEGKHKLIIGDEVVAGPNSVAGNITTMRAGTELADGTIEYRPNWTDATAKAEGQINKREFAKLLDEKYGPVGKNSTASATNDALSVVTKTDEVTEVASETAEAVVTKTDEVAEATSETAEAVVTKTDEVVETASETAEAVVTKTDEVAEVASETAETVVTKTDEVVETASETAEAVVTKTDEVAEAASETAEAVVTKTDEVAEAASETAEEVVTKTDEVAEAASETAEAVVTKTDEVAEVASETAEEVVTKTDEVTDVVEETGTHVDEATDVVEETGTHVDEATDIVEETGTHVDETTSNIGEVNESAIQSSSPMPGHSNFDDITEPVKYGGQTSESLFGENPGNRFSDLDAQRTSVPSRMKSIENIYDNYRNRLTNNCQILTKKVDDMLFSEDLDKALKQYQEDCEVFFKKCQDDLEKTLGNGSKDFYSSTRKFDYREIEFTDMTEVRHRYNELMERYGNNPKIKDRIESNYDSLKKFAKKYSDMQESTAQSFRSTMAEARIIETDLADAYKAAQYEQLTAMKSGPARTYTTFEEYAQTINLDGILNKNGNGIIKLGDVEIKTNPLMQKNIESWLGKDGLARVKSGVITVDDLENIQNGVVSTIQTSAENLGVQLPKQTNYFQVMEENFGLPPKYGIDELNDVNKYLSDISNQFDPSVISTQGTIPSEQLAKSLLSDSEISTDITKGLDEITGTEVVDGVSSTFDEPLYKHDYKKVTEEIGTNGEKITTTTELAGTPQEAGIRSIEYPDGTTKTESLKDGKWVDEGDVVSPKGDTQSNVINHTDEITDAVEEVSTHTDEVTDTVEEVSTHTDEVTDAVEEVSTHTDEVTDAVEEVSTHTDEVTDAVEEVSTHTDEVTDAVEEVSTHTDEVTDAVEEVSTHTDEVTDAVEEVSTHTDEVTDAVEEVSTHTDEVTDAVEEVSTHTDEVAAARKELETKLEDINSQRQATSETLETLQKQCDDLQTQISSKQAQKQALMEQFNKDFSRYQYSSDNVRGLIDELAPDGIHPHGADLIDPNNDLAEAIIDYYEQGLKFRQTGIGTLDATNLNKQLGRWYSLNELDLRMGGRNYQSALDDLAREYEQMVKTLTEYRSTIIESCPTINQMSKLTKEIMDLDSKAFMLQHQIEGMTETIESLSLSADDVMSQIDNLNVKSTSIVEEVGAHIDEATDIVEETGTHVDEATDIVEETGTHVDEATDIVEETGTHVDEATNIVEETGTHVDEVTDVVEETGTHVDEVTDVVEEPGTHVDESLESSTGSDTSSFDSGLEDVTGTKAPDLKVADDVEVVDISTSTGSSTPSHFDEILESAEESASKVFGHSNFDEIVEPVKYGDEVTESLFGENPGKRFEDLSRRKNNDISRLDQLQRDNYYYQEGLHSMRNDFNQLFDGQLFYEDLDSWVYKMRGKAEDFFSQYKTACSNAINSGSNNFSSRLIGSATSADDVLDLRKVQLFDDYELDQQYRMAKQRLEYKAEEMIAESLKYGRGDYSDVMRHISRQQETLETNYRRLRNFSREFSDMQDEMVRTYRNTIEEVRAIDTDLSKAYKASQYEQLSAIKSTPARTYTTFEEYAKTLNLDGIVNPNGSGIIKLGDIEIKATPDMLRQISGELGSEGMARVRTGVITVNDVQDIQSGIVESIRNTARDLDVTLPNRPNYIQTLDESFTRPAYGIDELNEVNQYLSDVSKKFNGEAISKASEMSGPKVIADSLAGDTGLSSKYAKLFSDSSSPNNAAIQDILKRAEEPIKIMKFSDAEDLIFGTSKSTDDLSSLFKDGPSTPKGTSESLDLEDLFGSSKTPDKLPNVFDDQLNAASEAAEAGVTKTDEVVEVASETAEEVVTKTDEVVVAARETAEEVVTKTDEAAVAVRETAEEVVTKADEAVVAARETAEEVVTKTDEVAVAARETAEEVVTKTDEAAVAARETAEEVVTKTDEVAVTARETAEEVVTKADEAVVAASETAEQIVTKTDEVVEAASETAEQVVTKTDEVASAVSETAEEAVRHTDEAITPSRSEELFASQNKAVGNAEYIEESSIFSRKNNARNVFKGNDVNAQINIPSQTPVITELQQQWVDYLNYEISMGRTPVALFNSTSEISSAMLSKIDDLSQVKIQLLDGLGDGNGMLKPKYNSQLYIDRVTYSGHEMKAIVKRLEQLQSKIDMSLPPSQRAKQIYDMLSTEIPVMHDFGSIPDGHKISASLRGLTPVNSAGKEGLVCAGYSSVYKELCERADIPCDYIRGKGNADPLRGGRAGGHAWNVVHTEIGDIPVDVTWSACSNGTKKWFGASEDFASTHWSNPDELYQDFSSASMTPRHTIGTSSEKMNDVINILEQKYGSRSEALSRLESYINSGDPHMITRTGGARDIILSTEPSYVQNYVYYARQNNGIQQIIDTMNYRNGDSTSGYYALRKYLETGNPQLITRTNGARDLLSSLDPNIIEQYLTGLGW